MTAPATTPAANTNSHQNNNVKCNLEHVAAAKAAAQRAFEEEMKKLGVEQFPDMEMAPVKPLAVSKRTVKLEAVRPIYAQSLNGELAVIEPGNVCFATEAEADMYCKPIPGNYDFGGERSEGEASRHIIVRAKRVS
jgi:hypothetical protein